jgi:hypothetical protein
MRDSAATNLSSPDSITVVIRALPGVPSVQLQPEKRLLLAVLEGAVSDFQTYATSISGRGRRLFADAQAWFGSTATEDLLAFESICEALGLDASFIRTGLARWCVLRQSEPPTARTLIRFPFRRVNGARHRLSQPS